MGRGRSHSHSSARRSCWRPRTAGIGCCSLAWPWMLLIDPAHPQARTRLPAFEYSRCEFVATETTNEANVSFSQNNGCET